MPGANLGSIYFNIKADTAEATARLEEFRNKSEETAAAVEQTNEAQGNSFLELGEKVDKSTEGLRKLQGALTGIIGIASGVAGGFLAIGAAIRAVNEYADAGRKEFEKWNAALVDDDAEQRLKALNDKLIEVNAEIAAQNEGLGRVGFGRRASQLEREQKTLLEGIKAASQQVRIQRLRASEEEAILALKEEQAELDAQAAQAAAIEAANRALIIQSYKIEGNERKAIELEIEQRRKKVEKDIAAARSVEVRRALSDQLQLIEVIEAKQMEALKRKEAAEEKSRRERLQKEREANQRIADNLAKAFESAIARVQSQGDAANEKLLGTVQSLARQVDLIAKRRN